MAELDDRLKRLVSDEQSMKRVLELASAIMERKAAAPPPEPTPPAQDAAPQKPDMAALLGALVNNASTAHTPAGTAAPTPEPSAETAAQEPGPAPPADPTAALMAALPQLLQALSGNGELVQSERANLIRAMTPYLSDRRVGSLDRALRMANVTKAAKSALHILGR